ncbi:MAG: hypothetical protein ACXVW1_10780 [Nocardioides sp.]
MTWKSFHRRGEVLREVIAAADDRRDGILPLDVDGVRETFGDELTLIGALQLRWHTRLAGRIERELVDRPDSLGSAVVAAWQATADEMPGVRSILDHYRSAPLDEAMASALTKATAKEHVLLAVMAGQAGVHDQAAARVGARLEQEARAKYRPFRQFTELPSHTGFLDRIKAALAA